jgi:hypothetical protein
MRLLALTLLFSIIGAEDILMLTHPARNQQYNRMPVTRIGVFSGGWPVPRMIARLYPDGRWEVLGDLNAEIEEAKGNPGVLCVLEKLRDPQQNRDAIVDECGPLIRASSGPFKEI